MYQALYRKWRPLVFSDMVGQSHITGTLKNEVKENKLGHAYLFTGTRGTGKTSCAKILARAVNCLSPVNGDPCNACEICVGISDGSIMDIIEIDAASNNGVDDIRELREEAIYSPSRARKKVYIIDEVHMLSTGAFNALLKTLEEPPSHILFILATTEIHKIPATILSRCQRFDFKRISVPLIIERLEFVCEKEGIEIEREALTLISRIADGSMRDALSVLDLCAGIGKKITVSEVQNSTGSSGKEHINHLSEAIINGDIVKCLNIISNLYSNSKDMARLCEELIGHYRDMLIIKSVEKPNELLDCTDEELKMITSIAVKYKLERVLYCINTLQDALNRMSRSANKRVEAEIAIVRLCDNRLSDMNDALLSRLAELEAKVQTGVIKRAVMAEEIEEPKELAPKKEKTQKSNGKTTEAHFWSEVLENLKATKNMILYSLLKTSKALIDENELTILTDNVMAIEAVGREEDNRLLSDTVLGISGTRYKLKASSKKPQVKADDDFESFMSENAEDIEII